MEGKESLSIDLQAPAGREVMHKLVAEADVFVTSFRPGVPERLGLDHETVRALTRGWSMSTPPATGRTAPTAPGRCMRRRVAAVGGMNRHAGSWLDPALTQDWGIPELAAIVKPRLAAPTMATPMPPSACCRR